MRTKKLCVSIGVILAVVVLMAVSLSVTVASAQEGAPPVLPCAFYGNVTIDEKPAPIGTEITAKMDNKTCGNITVTEEGRYGGAGGFDLKLLVIGTAEDENKNVSFYVGGIKAKENATWHSGAPPKHFDLSVKKPAVGPNLSAVPIAAVIGIAVVVVIAVVLIFVVWRKKRAK